MGVFKYQNRKYIIYYSKQLTKREKSRINSELKLKNLQINLNSGENRKLLYNHCKNDWESIYDYNTDDIKVKSKCEWYEHGENSTKLFLNLEKKRDIRDRVQKLIVKEKETTDPKEISKNIKVFYETLFKQNFWKTYVK